MRPPRLSGSVRHSPSAVEAKMRTPRTVDALPARTRAFRKQARAFCQLVAGHKRYPLRSFLRTVHHSLPALYAAGLQLPDITPERDASYSRVATQEWSRLFRSLKSRLGTRTYYCEVFDAYDRHDRGSLIGNLADDLSDIHGDLTNGFLC